MTKLTKAQEKRFDEKFGVPVADTEKERLIYKKGGIDVLEAKQHLADELARERKKYRDEVKNMRAEQLELIDDLEKKVEKRHRELLAKQKKEIIEKLEKMHKDSADKTYKFVLDQAIKSIK